MEFNFNDYQPINYRTWILGDKAREGVNLMKLGLLDYREYKIFKAAAPYQDQRDDPGQGEMVAYFTIKLLDYLPGNREVAVPAAILHDTGYYGIDANAWKNLVNTGEDTNNEASRRPHQNRGCLLAGRILEKTNYPEEHHFEIADIIGDHDTRNLPTTESGEIMRAADLLWRCTFPGIEAYMPNASPDEWVKRMESKAFNYSQKHKLGKIESQIGKIELVNTMLTKFQEEAECILHSKYKKELEKVKNFYNNKT
jgi:hypothetical protein